VCHHGNHIGRRTAHATMVVAAHLVHRWARSDGGVCASAAEFVSIPGDLDVAALDSRYGVGLADTARGADSNERRRARSFTWVKHPAMGGGALPDDGVGGAITSVRSGSKPGDRYILWRSDIRRHRDAITDLVLGACTGGSGFRYGLYSLPAR